MAEKRIRTTGVRWEEILREAEKVEPRPEAEERPVYRIDPHGITAQEDMIEAIREALKDIRDDEPGPTVYELTDPDA